jgi:hypothetical protein
MVDGILGWIFPSVNVSTSFKFFVIIFTQIKDLPEASGPNRSQCWVEVSECYTIWDICYSFKLNPTILLSRYNLWHKIHYFKCILSGFRYIQHVLRPAPLSNSRTFPQKTLYLQVVSSNFLLSRAATNVLSVLCVFLFWALHMSGLITICGLLRVTGLFSPSVMSARFFML